MSRFVLLFCVTVALGASANPNPMWKMGTREPLVPEGEPETILEGRVGPPMDTSTALAFSPDGRTLATGSDRLVRLWEVATGRELRRLEGFTDVVDSLAFSPDGRTLASVGDDKAVRLWEVATGREVLSLRDHSSSVESLAFSPDGRTLASGDSAGGIHLWAVTTGNKLQTLQGHTSPVQALAFSPDGHTLASGGWDQQVRLWELTTGITKRTFESGVVQTLAFSSDGRILAIGTRIGSVDCWDLLDGRSQYVHSHSGSVRAITFLPGGQTLVSAGVDGVVQLKAVINAWQDDIIKAHKEKPLLDSPVETVAFSPDGRVLVWSLKDGSVQLWSITGPLLERLDSPSKPLWSVAFAPDGRTLASGGGDGMVRLWDMATGHEQQRLNFHTSSIQSVAFSPDGRTLVAGGMDGLVRLWDLDKGRELQSLTTPSSVAQSAQRASDAPSDSVRAVAFSPDGRTVALGGGDGAVRLWAVGSGRRPYPFKGYTGPVQTVAFSPDGRTLASGSGDGTVRLWAVGAEGSGQEPRSLTGHEGGVQSVAFSPDGRILASAGFDKKVRLWTVDSGRRLHLLSGHTSPVQTVAFSPDGRTLASGSGDGTVRLWAVATGRESGLLEARGVWISSLAFSPDGRTLAAGGTDGTTRLWFLPLSSKGKTPTGLLRAGHLGWLSHLPGRPVFRHDGGRLLYRQLEGGALEAIPPPSTEVPPQLSIEPPSPLSAKDLGYPQQVVFTISNAPDAGRAYWVRVEAIELPPGLRFLNSGQLLRLDPGQSMNLSVELSYMRPEGTVLPETPQARFRVTHAFGEGPSTLVPIKLRHPELVLVDKPRVEGSILTFTLKNIGTQETGPLSVRGRFAAQELPHLSGSLWEFSGVQQIQLDPGEEAQLSIPLLSVLHKLDTFSFDILASHDDWPRTWFFSTPEVKVPVPYVAYGALALGALLLFAGVHYVRVYRNPLVMQAATAPAQLKAWPLADMPKADHALRRANRRDSTITAAGIPLTRWERMLGGTRTPREAALAFAEALGGQLGAPLGARAWALSLPPLRLRFARDTALLVLDGTRLESGDAERAMTDVFQDGRGPSQVLVLDRTHAQNAAQLLCDTPRVRSVVLSGDRLRDLLLADEPIRLLETTIAQQVSVSELSPYQVAGGVKLEHLFFGREREVRAIVDRSLRNFLVVGQRQMGKSSLLLAVLRRLQARGDVDATYMELADADLHRRLARERGAVPAGGALPPFVEVAAGTPARPRVWLIDEADDFIRTDARADYPVVKAMRALAEEGRAYFILAGFWDLYRAVVLDEQQPLRNFGEHLRLEPLDARSALALVTEPMAALGLEWDAPASPEYLLEQAGRRANLLVLACKALVESLPTDTRVLTREHLERVLREDKDLRDQGRRWRGDYPLHRAVVRQALLMGRPTREEVRQALKARGADVRSTDFDEAMDHRELSYVLVPDGEGRLYCPVPLMQRYIESERGLEAGLGEDLEDLRRGFSDVPPPA